MLLLDLSATFAGEGKDGWEPYATKSGKPREKKKNPTTNKYVYRDVRKGKGGGQDDGGGQKGGAAPAAPLRRLGIKERANIKDQLVGHGKMGPHDVIHQDGEGKLFLHQHDKDKPKELSHPDQTEGFDPHNLDSYKKLASAPKGDGGEKGGQKGDAAPAEAKPKLSALADQQKARGGDSDVPYAELVHPAEAILGDKVSKKGAAADKHDAMLNPAQAAKGKRGHQSQLTHPDDMKPSSGSTGWTSKYGTSDPATDGSKKGGDIPYAELADEDNRSAPKKLEPKGKLDLGSLTNPADGAEGDKPSAREALENAFDPKKNKEAAKYVDDLQKQVKAAGGPQAQGDKFASAARAVTGPSSGDKDAGKKAGGGAMKALEGLAWGINRFADVAYVANHPLSTFLGAAFTKATQKAEDERKTLEGRYGKPATHIICATATMLAAISPPGVSHLMAYSAPGRWLSRMPALALAEATLQGGQAAKYLGSKMASGIARAYGKVADAVGYAKKNLASKSSDAEPIGYQQRKDAGLGPIKFSDEDRGSISLSAEQIHSLALKMATTVCGHFMLHAKKAMKDDKGGAEAKPKAKKVSKKKPEAKPKAKKAMSVASGEGKGGSKTFLEHVA